MADLLYTPRPGDPMRIVTMFSGGASAYEPIKSESGYGTRFVVVGAGTNKLSAAGAEKFVRDGKPVITFNYRAFCASHDIDSKDDHSRMNYYEHWCRLLDPFKPDVVMLSGYMHLLAEPFISHYLTINVHPASLGWLSASTSPFSHDFSGQPSDKAYSFIRQNKATPRFAGSDAVYTTVMADIPETRSSVHIVTKQCDAGPILVQSKTVPIEPGNRGNREYAQLLQNQMKRECDGPAYRTAVRLIADGSLGRRGDTIFLHTQELPYGGYLMSE